ncbi:hypothetical protein F3Y22_tig00110392pilonHSYRG00145 [Hibiscus syriacus]|uniref:F-box domain-containing protein n=1 Tax=Hibiscus syriacus TaxID=106335 RepID=A0A6A3APH0_HIBSY|nr:F-box/FBD/LRR-repeat protein At2g26030-like [Hibiscus syriacus]KAE8706530.1 hypothetical protein F3Y22_tig00110392pilonHSYRG00145 [Hibiscus syriacus]
MVKQIKSVGVLDRISNLPDHILCDVLSFLPGKDAARTSVLSHRWRYLFVSSLSTLDFTRFLAPRENDENFLEFVDRFFSNPNRVSLECFRVNDFWVDCHIPLGKSEIRWGINPPWRDDYVRLDGWICAALRRGVKEFGIHSINQNFLTLPTLLFTCQSLVTLKLSITGAHHVPSNACLPNLRTLHFAYFVFRDGPSVLKLISSCPLLEDLAFVRCRFHERNELNISSLSLKRLVLDFEKIVARDRGFDLVAVNAPNLVYFKYVDNDDMAEGCTLSDMKSLEKADVKITLLGSEGRGHARNLLRRICNIQSLYLAIEDLVVINQVNVFETQLESVFAFHNLVEFEFVNYSDWQAAWIVEFLHCMPNLMKLVLDLRTAEEGFGSLPNALPACLLFHLKEIETGYIKEDEGLFELISYFLKHALVLEKLVIRIYASCDEDRLHAIEKLSSLPKGSKKCDVMFLD